MVFVGLFDWLKKVVSEAIFLDIRTRNRRGPRPIKAGLGVHESGVSRGRRGAEEHITTVIKTGTICSAERATFSDFVWADSENPSEN